MKHFWRSENNSWEFSSTLQVLGTKQQGRQTGQQAPYTLSHLSSLTIHALGDFYLRDLGSHYSSGFCLFGFGFVFVFFPRSLVQPLLLSHPVLSPPLFSPSLGSECIWYLRLYGYHMCITLLVACCPFCQAL